MKKRLLLLIAPILTLILEALPYGAVLNFANPAEDGTISYIRETFSYFDPTVFGYANFGPMLTAVLTCIITVLVIVYVIKPIRLLRSVLSVLHVIALVTSVMPMSYGMIYLSAVGLIVTALLLIEAVLLTKIE